MAPSRLETREIGSFRIEVAPMAVKQEGGADLNRETLEI
jgi:hypothetical protein